MTGLNGSTMLRATCRKRARRERFNLAESQLEMAYQRLEPGSPSYPLSVTHALPHASTLYAIGATELLARPAIGICGSRAASESALRYAEQFGSIAADVGFVVVSGHAKGVDRAAHKGALKANGATIVVSPEGIDHFKPARELREFVDLVGNFVAVSQFEPHETWASYRAMQRNKYIVALSRALFVVEAREKGGTIAAGLEALRQKKPLWVIDFAKDQEGREGNRVLIERGGRPVRTARELKQILATELQRDAQVPEQKALVL